MRCPVSNRVFSYGADLLLGARAFIVKYNYFLNGHGYCHNNINIKLPFWQRIDECRCLLIHWNITGVFAIQPNRRADVHSRLQNWLISRNMNRLLYVLVSMVLGYYLNLYRTYLKRLCRVCPITETENNLTTILFFCQSIWKGRQISPNKLLSGLVP